MTLSQISSKFFLCLTLALTFACTIDKKNPFTLDDSASDSQPTLAQPDIEELPDRPQTEFDIDAHIAAWERPVSLDAARMLLDALEENYLHPEIFSTEDWKLGREITLADTSITPLKLEALVSLTADEYTMVMPYPKGLAGDPSNEARKAQASVTGKLVKHHDRQVAYISIWSFDLGAHQVFLELAKRLILEGADFVVIDLRWNSGGDVNEAFQIASYFLGDTKMGHITDSSNQLREYRTRKDARILLPTAMLVNRETASASEILASALTISQDEFRAGLVPKNNRAFLVGSITYGKGVGQVYMSFNEELLLRVTSAHLTKPSGKSWHHLGLIPHYELNANENENFLALEPNFRGSQKDTVYLEAFNHLDLFCKTVPAVCTFTKALQPYALQAK